MAIRMRKKGQLTLPHAIRKAAQLDEGDPIEVEMTPEGILLRPQKVIDSTQAWFWTSAWQAGEAEAAADISSGRMEVSGSGEELLGALDE